MSNLSNQQINQTFANLLQVPGGITSSLQTVQDGNGNPTGLQLSSTGANVTTSDTFVASVNGTQITGSVARLISDGFSDFVSVKDFGAIGNGVADDTAALQSAIASGQTVIGKAGETYKITSGLTLQTGQIFDLNGATLITTASAGLNMVTMADYSVLRNGKINGNDPTWIGTSTGVFLAGANYAVVSNITCSNLGFHGFASEGVTLNGGCKYSTIENCRAIVCGERGINLSAGSKGNSIKNFVAINCNKAGILFGYTCQQNRIEDVYISGTDNASIWVHMNCYYNVFTNICIDPPKVGNTSPSIIIGAASYSNQFSNVTINGATSRGLYIWNQAVDHPELGTVNAPVQNNHFSNFIINGTSVSASSAIRFNNSATYVTQNNTFDGFYLNGFAYGMDDEGGYSQGEEFRNVRFGTITSRPYKMGGNTGNYGNSRVYNVQNVSGLGSLALAVPGFDAQPSVPLNAVAVTQPYPFPVLVFLADMVSGGVMINGVNTPIASPASYGNGMYLLLPNQTITLNYSSGSPSWRWFGVN